MTRTIEAVTLLGICLACVGCNMGTAAKGARHLQANATADARSRSAVDNVIAWEGKYAELSDKCVKLLEDKQVLTEKSQNAMKIISQLQEELAQAKEELADANAMLGEMNKELAQWKVDVLGFREEMRRAQEVQLRLMTKMVVLLGGEVPAQEDKGPEKLAARTKE